MPTTPHGAAAPSAGPTIGPPTADYQARSYVTAALANAEPMLRHGNHPFLPDAITVDYESYGKGWETRHIAIQGRRIRKDGSLGQRVNVPVFRDEIPPWVQQFAQANRPAGGGQ
jgi:hypothetical protein